MVFFFQKRIFPYLRTVLDQFLSTKLKNTKKYCVFLKIMDFRERFHEKLLKWI